MSFTLFTSVIEDEEYESLEIRYEDRIVSVKKLSDYHFTLGIIAKYDNGTLTHAHKEYFILHPKESDVFEHVASVMSFIKKERKVKIALFGDSGVGKTTFVNKLLTGNFNQKHAPTVGVDTRDLRFTLRNEKICATIWDTAGRHVGLGEAYYISSDIGIYMYKDRLDMSKIEAFKRVAPSANLFILRNKHGVDDLIKNNSKSFLLDKYIIPLI